MPIRQSRIIRETLDLLPLVIFGIPLFIIFLVSNAIAAEDSVCQFNTPSTSDLGVYRRLCQGIVTQPLVDRLCSMVPSQDRIKCKGSNFSQAVYNYGQCAPGFLSGSGNALWDTFVQFPVDTGKFLYEVVTQENLTGKAVNFAGSSLANIRDGGDYVASLIVSQQSREQFARLANEKFTKVANQFDELINLLEPKVACMNTGARMRVSCHFLAELFVPPDVLFRVLRMMMSGMKAAEILSSLKRDGETAVTLARSTDGLRFSTRVWEPAYQGKPNILSDIIKDVSRREELQIVMGRSATSEMHLKGLLKGSGSDQEITNASLAWAQAKQAEYRLLGYQSEIKFIAAEGDIPAHSALRIVDSPNPLITGTMKSTATRNVNVLVDPVATIKRDAPGLYDQQMHSIIIGELPISREAAFLGATEFRHEVRHAKTMVDLTARRPSNYYASFYADEGETLINSNAYGNFLSLDELATYERMSKQASSIQRVGRREVEKAERAGKTPNLSEEYDLASRPGQRNGAIQEYQNVAVGSATILSRVERGLANQSVHTEFTSSTLRNVNTVAWVEVPNHLGQRVGVAEIYLLGSSGPNDPNNAKLLRDYVANMRRNAQDHERDAMRLLVQDGMPK